MRRNRIGVGFVLLVLVYGLAAFFFAWGLSPPALDRAWRLGLAVRVGPGALSAAERGQLDACLAQYPALAGWLLDGRTIGLVSAERGGWLKGLSGMALRTPAAADRRVLQVRVSDAPGGLPAELRVEGRGWRERIPIERPRLVDVGLPALGETAELISIELVPAHPERAAELGIWVSFPGGRAVR